jgi:hypothetical protein
MLEGVGFQGIGWGGSHLPVLGIATTVVSPSRA